MSRRPTALQLALAFAIVRRAIVADLIRKLQMLHLLPTPEIGDARQRSWRAGDVVLLHKRHRQMHPPTLTFQISFQFVAKVL